MNKIRLLSSAAILIAAGIVVFGPDGGLDPRTRACLETTANGGALDLCTDIYQTHDLSDVERGLIAYRIGRLHEAPRDWEQAAAFYSDTIALFPQKTQAFYRRGWLRHHHLDDGDGALADLTHYIDTHADPIAGLTVRAVVYRANEELELATQDIAAALAIRPDDPWALRERAEILQLQGDDAGALAVLDQAIEANPDVMGPWRERSWLKREMGDYTGALADIGHVIGTDPTAMWPWYQSGWLNMRLGNYERALTDLQTARQKDPNYRPAQRTMDELLSTIQDKLEGQPARLTALAEAGLINAPADEDLLYLRAIGQRDEGRFIGAINDVNQIIATTDYPELFVFVRSAIHVSAQQLDLAMNDLEWLTRDPAAHHDTINKVAARAQALRDDGRSAAAAALDSDVGDLVSLYPTALRMRIGLSIAQNNWPAALEAIDLMLAYDGDDSRYWTARGGALEQLNRPDEAFESYSAAIRLVEAGSNDLLSDATAQANAYLRRGALYQSQRRAVEAEADFANALTRGGADLIRAFQQKMKDADHYRGPINGTFDDATKAAVGACARDSGC